MLNLATLNVDCEVCTCVCVCVCVCGGRGGGGGGGIAVHSTCVSLLMLAKQIQDKFVIASTSS